jgi:hypothetical protein
MWSDLLGSRELAWRLPVRNISLPRCRSFMTGSTYLMT